MSGFTNPWDTFRLVRSIMEIKSEFCKNKKKFSRALPGPVPRPSWAGVRGRGGPPTAAVPPCGGTGEDRESYCLTWANFGLDIGGKLNYLKPIWGGERKIRFVNFEFWVLNVELFRLIWDFRLYQKVAADTDLIGLLNSPCFSPFDLLHFRDDFALKRFAIFLNLPRIPVYDFRILRKTVFHLYRPFHWYLLRLFS